MTENMVNLPPASFIETRSIANHMPHAWWWVSVINWAIPAALECNLAGVALRRATGQVFSQQLLYRDQHDEWTDDISSEKALR
jgi:hypothetical protein